MLEVRETTWWWVVKSLPPLPNKISCLRSFLKSFEDTQPIDMGEIFFLLHTLVFDFYGVSQFEGKELSDFLFLFFENI